MERDHLHKVDDWRAAGKAGVAPVEQEVVAGPSVAQQQKKAAEDKADQLLRGAEQSKAWVYDLPGNGDNNLESQINDQLNLICFGQEMSKKGISAVEVDEDYILVASHIDDNTRAKIGNHEYIDFTKLIRHDRGDEDNVRMVMVNKGGYSYLVPSEKAVVINSYSRWEQAFRVYLLINSEVYPGRTTELVQYNHIIQTAQLHMPGKMSIYMTRSSEGIWRGNPPEVRVLYSSRPGPCS